VALCAAIVVVKCIMYTVLYSLVHVISLPKSGCIVHLYIPFPSFYYWHWVAVSRTATQWNKLSTTLLSAARPPPPSVHVYLPMLIHLF